MPRPPPLRDRRADIPALVRHFLAHPGFSLRVAKRLSPAALERLLDYDWPGNVRELRNSVERAIILSGNKLKIDVEDFTLGKHPLPQAPSCLATSRQEVSLSFDHEPTLAEVERQYLRLLLSRQRRSRAELARVLGIGERTLYRLLTDIKEDYRDP